jgi:hypothetical protein
VPAAAAYDSILNRHNYLTTSSYVAQLSLASNLTSLAPIYTNSGYFVLSLSMVRQQSLEKLKPAEEAEVKIILRCYRECCYYKS